MTDFDYQEMEHLNYIEENAHLINKLDFYELDTLSELTSNTHDCILMLKGIKDLTSKDQIVVENIKPTILDLKRVIKKIKALAELRTSIDYTLKLLDTICNASQNLTDELSFLHDINTGLFGRSDYLDKSDFVYEKMYYFSEKYFNELILNITLFIKQFEQKGESKAKKKKSNDLIQDISELIQIVIYLAEKTLPFALFIRLPKVFKKCKAVGEKIEIKLQILYGTKKLIKMLPTIEKAEIELAELAIRYKDKPDKNISLEPIINKKDAAEELGHVLRSATRLFKLL